MDRLNQISVLLAAVATGCDSRAVTASVELEPPYQAIVPADLPSTWTLGNKDGNDKIVNARETYLAWHRSGWNAYLFELRRVSDKYSSDLDLPFPQCTGYEMSAYFDGYNQCRFAHARP